MPDEEDVMLSTSDNPYSPFEQFDEWNAFDMQMGYHTCSYLARIVKTSDELSEVDQEEATLLGINKIIELNLTGNYVKVRSKDFKK